ncbi:MAG: sensor histidine kinase [Flammeovirgaceae bacterium]
MKESDPEKYSLFIHMGLWLIVLHLMFDISGLYRSFHVLVIEGKKEFDDAFIYIPLMLLLFYVNSVFLIPKYFNRTAWWKYAIGITVSFIACIYLNDWAYLAIVNLGYQLPIEYRDAVDQFFFICLFTIAFSTSYGVSRVMRQTSIQKQEALEKQQEAELKYLAAQINPHFLFNTLNTLYALAIEEDAPRTTDAMLKLAEIMRYPVKHGAKDRVKLTTEVDFLQDYVALQQIRLGPDYPIQMTIEGDVANHEIAPLLVISFIENAFKYGISQQKPQPIRITLRCDANQIQFTCQNSIVKSNAQNSNELGLKNVRQRLNLLYPNRHQLEITDDGTTYRVELKLAGNEGF